MSLRWAAFQEFHQLRPRLRLLLELHRTAETDEARARLAQNLEDAFLAAAWHIARDLLDNGWAPVSSEPITHRRHLTVVNGGGD
jgi:hypothetical protein